jgi:hypothetical protein
MLLTLERTKVTKASMTGSLYVDGKFECYTLEDVPRPVKVQNETAIAAGKYRVIINQSVRFKRRLPLLLNVPNFVGIRIHSGNTNHHTEGCILVGTTLRKDFVGNSRLAFSRLFKKMDAAAKAGEDLMIEIIDKY